MGYRVKLFKEIKTVNELIIALRKSLGINQTAFGKILGYSRETISNWETGNKMSPELETGIKIGIAATRRGVPVDEIIAFGLDSYDLPEADDSQTDEREAA
jgi:DNA-binding XRE family transcriptional regulator